MTFTDGIFYVAILIMSVVIHEVAHGYMAYRLGDETARLQGRLTLNPISHLDIFGSLLLPLLLVLSNAGFVVGWAKPVPYNPNNLRGRNSVMFVAIAGILANIGLAIIFGLLIRIFSATGISFGDTQTMISFYKISSSIVLVNIVLALFNLIPIPPLDGSKVLFGLLPQKYSKFETVLEQWGMFILLFFIIFIWQYLSPFIFIVFNLLTGIS
jgi:Zn-dependent protease